MQWTRSSKLISTHSFMAYIIMFILSFIVYMSYAMRILLLSSFDRQSVSSLLVSLLVTLLSSSSSLSRWLVVGGKLSLFSSSC